MSQRPKILILCTDLQRLDSLGYTGSTSARPFWENTVNVFYRKICLNAAQLVRVPLIVRAPGRSGGALSDLKHLRALFFMMLCAFFHFAVYLRG